MLSRSVRFFPLLALAMFSLMVFAAFGQTASAADIEGKWEGKWEECDGRSGHICATVHKLDCNRYRVCFTGICHHIVPFVHDVKFCVVGQPCDRVIMTGTSTFHHIDYKANVTCTQFLAEYCGHHHKGRICMTRCGCHAGGPPAIAVAPHHGHGAPPLYGR